MTKYDDMRADATNEADVRFAAQDALIRSQRLLDRVGGTAEGYLLALDEVRFISPAQEKAAAETAGAALNVAEATKNLQAALLRHESALAEIESLQTLLSEANAHLESCLKKAERANAENELSRIAG